MATVTRFRVTFQEDADCRLLARVTAPDGTGAATGIDGEGNWVKQADLSTITCAVYDRDSTTPNTAVQTPTVAISSAILDTPVATNVNWTQDGAGGLNVTGYNFTHDLAANCFPTGGHRYEVEYKFTTTGSKVFWVIFEGPADPVRTS